MSDTHPRFIVAPYAWPDGEVGYLVVDTLGENGSSPEVMCADSDAHCGRIAEALNFHHDLAPVETRRVRVSVTGDPVSVAAATEAINAELGEG